MFNLLFFWFRGLFNNQSEIVQEPSTGDGKDSFQAFLNKHGIKHFSEKEVFYGGGANEKLNLNSEPPRELWNNILPVLKVLDRVREKCGRLKLTSIYRNPEYNKRIGGAVNSQHLKFTACDVISLDCTIEHLHKAIMALRDSGAFKGGVGKYKTFIHIDSRGANVNW